MDIFLANKVVRFWLSPEGRVALKGIFDKEAFQAYVHSVDELGAPNETRSGLYVRSFVDSVEMGLFFNGTLGYWTSNGQVEGSDQSSVAEQVQEQQRNGEREI